MLIFIIMYVQFYSEIEQRGQEVIQNVQFGGYKRHWNAYCAVKSHTGREAPSVKEISVIKVKSHRNEWKGTLRAFPHQPSLPLVREKGSKSSSSYNNNK